MRSLGVPLFGEGMIMVSAVSAFGAKHPERGGGGLLVLFGNTGIFCASGCLSALARAVHKVPDFFCLLRTALKDRPKGPPTANRRQPPPTASGDQPPTANHYQPPPTTNHQPPTAANHHQPPPTASCQLPTSNRRQPPAANRHQPWLNTWSTRGLFLEKLCTGTLFFFC